MDYVALKSEIQNDPAGLGYATYVASGADGTIATILNTTGVGVAFSIYRDDVGVHELIAAIDATNFGSLTALQVQKLTLLFSGTSTLDATNANTRLIVQGIFSGMSATLTNFAALAKRQGTRAEVLFGPGVRVSDDDVARALRG